MKKVLITGFNGFVGRHASREFRARGYEIHGVTDKPVDADTAATVDKVSICNLADPAATSGLDIDSDKILNLAGFATNTGTDTELVHSINIGAHVNLYKRVLELGLSPRIIAVSTGLVYDPAQSMPINEDGAIRDPELARPYEASKVRMEQALTPFFEAGLDIIVARPFNHIGPAQGRGFIVPDFAYQIEKFIATGEAIETGSLNTRRDYSSVQSVVRRYIDLMEADSHQHDVYNICSGTPIAGREILRLLCTEYGIAMPQGTETDAMLRPGEIAEFYGNNARITNEFGPQESISVEQIIRDYVKWRKSQVC